MRDGPLEPGGVAYPRANWKVPPCDLQVKLRWHDACRGRVETQFLAETPLRALIRSLLVAAAMLAALPTTILPAAADSLPQPAGPVILRVTGAIANRNEPDAAAFDRAMLESLGTAQVTTSTSWTDGTPTFEGVPLAAILDAVGASGTTLHAVAINDYAIDLDVAEVRKYPVLAAMKQDGRELRLRDRGPIWIVYPRDAYPELAPERNDYKWIWQLKQIDVR